MFWLYVDVNSFQINVCCSDDNKSHIAYVTNGSLQSEDWRLFGGLYDFTISFWFVDIDEQEGKLLAYTNDSDVLFNMELLKIVNGNRLLLQYCGRKFMYSISTYMSARNLIWHNIAVAYSHNIGIRVYMDGSRLYEDHDSETQQYCLLSPG